jgi:hypothetical protein
MTTLPAPARTASVNALSHQTAVALLIEPSACVSASILQPLELQGYEVRVAEDLTEALAAALVVVEADRGARCIALVKRLHALAPDIPIVGVLPWWNDDEAEVVRIARFILHVPVRDDQVQALADLAESARRRAGPLAL